MEMKTIAVSQPTYLPWWGYFELIARVDVFVFLDSVQFEKQSWQSRNRLRTKRGEIVWLSVPVSKAPLATPLAEIEIAPNPPRWREKHLKTIEACLGSAPAYGEILPELEGLGSHSSHHLADLNIDFITRMSRKLGIRTEFARSSTLPVEGEREGLLLGLCRHFGADRYYSNQGSAVYLEGARALFESEGVRIDYQTWPHPEYRQVGVGFVTHLSIIDAVACLGYGEVAAGIATT